MSTCYWNMFERKNRIYHGIIASFVLDLTWVDAKRKSWKVDLILLLIDNFINWISIQYYFHSKRKNLPMTCRRLSQMTLTGITFLPNPAQQRQTIMNRIRFFRPFAFALINFQKTKTKPQFRENWRKAKPNLKCPRLTKETKTKTRQWQDKLPQAIPSIEREKLRTVSLFLKKTPNQSPLSNT